MIDTPETNTWLNLQKIRCAVIWKDAGRFVTWSFRTYIGTFRTGVKMYSETFRTFFSTHRFVRNSLIKMLYVQLKLWN